MKTIISLLGMVSLVCVGALASAAEVTCSDDSGSCTLSENMVSCECANGIAMGSGFDVPEDGDADAMDVTEEACNAWLEETCAGWEVVDECETQKGACVLYANESISCECADGNWGDGGSSEPGEPGEGGGSDPGEIDPDEGGTDEAQPRARLLEGGTCDEQLAEVCPNDPPDPAESCSTDALATCNALGQWYVDCYDSKLWPYMIIDCCADLEREGSELPEVWACLQEKSCDEADSCFPSREADESAWDSALGGNDDGEQTGEDGDLADNEADGDVLADPGIGDGSGDGGCSQSGGPAWLGLLMLLGLALRRQLA
jgi:MYXO-CTERM domain-containing protein